MEPVHILAGLSVADEEVIAAILRRSRMTTTPLSQREGLNTIEDDEDDLENVPGSIHGTSIKYPKKKQKRRIGSRSMFLEDTDVQCEDEEDDKFETHPSIKPASRKIAYNLPLEATSHAERNIPKQKNITNHMMTAMIKLWLSSSETSLEFQLATLHKSVREVTSNAEMNEGIQQIFVEHSNALVRIVTKASASLKSSRATIESGSHATNSSAPSAITPNASISLPAEIELPTQLPLKASVRCHDLFNRPQVRRFKTNQFWMKKGKEVSLEDKNGDHRLYAALMFTRGEERLGKERCNNCQKRNGPFAGCIIIGDALSCTCCTYFEGGMLIMAVALR